jgi:hypothetical protein
LIARLTACLREHGTRFGVSGPGWYGPGNGEEIGELYNPARARPLFTPL